MNVKSLRYGKLRRLIMKVEIFTFMHSVKSRIIFHLLPYRVSLTVYRVNELASFVGHWADCVSLVRLPGLWHQILRSIL